MNSKILACCAILLALSCSACERQRTAVPSYGLPADSVENAQFFSEDFGTVHLSGGRFEQQRSDTAIPLFVRLIGTIAFGDVNNDTLIDAVSAIAVNGGGSGVFVSVAVFLNDNGRAHHHTSYLLGDRIRPDSLRIVNGIVEVFFKDRTPDQPLSDEGSVPRKVTLRLRGGELLAAEEEVNDVW